MNLHKSIVIFFLLHTLPLHASEGCKPRLFANGSYGYIGDSLNQTVPEADVGTVAKIRHLDEVLAQFPPQDKIVFYWRKQDNFGTGTLRVQRARPESYPTDSPEWPFFIKVPQIERLDGIQDGHSPLRNHENVANEIYWTQYLSKEGWGVPFHGAFKTEDSRVGISTDFLPISALHASSKLSQAQRLAARKRIIALKKWFLEKQIKPVDLQIRFNQNGIPYVVDPEFFTREKLTPEDLADFNKRFDDILSQIPAFN